jgi:hypothetical protein
MLNVERWVMLMVGRMEIENIPAKVGVVHFVQSHVLLLPVTLDIGYIWKVFIDCTISGACSRYP